MRAKIEPIYDKIISSKPFENLTKYAQTSLTHYLVPLWSFDDNGAPPRHNISDVNRKEHSKSTYHIVKKFFEFHPELKEDDSETRAKIAALLHDIGALAALHYNEFNLPYLIDGIENHEQYAEYIMHETEIRDAITELCTIDEVAKIIEGRDNGAGCIVNNGNHPTPDADSIHNLIMYLMAYVNMNGNRLPDPTKLIKHMKIENGALLMENGAETEFDAYNRCRKIMYDEIHGIWHTSAASILTYSLGHTLAERGKETLVDDGFLDFGDKELIMYLKNDPLLNELISRTQKGILPVCIAEAETSKPSEYLMKIHKDLLERYRYSNDIAERLGGNFEKGDFTLEISKLKFRKGMDKIYNIRGFVNQHKIKDFDASKKKAIDFSEFSAS